MNEEEFNSSITQVAPDSNDVQGSDVSQQQHQIHDDVNDRNWREMRQRQKELENSLRQKNEMLDKLLKMQQSQPAPQIDTEEPDDDFIPKGRVKELARKAAAPLEEKIKALEARVQQQEVSKNLSSLQRKYSDFDDVVNVETLELLEKQEPELAAAIAESQDPYKMAIQSYKYIKALNLVEKLPSQRRIKETTKRIEQNEKTVQSPMAYDKRPMAQAYNISDADRRKLYEEMMLYAQQSPGF